MAGANACAIPFTSPGFKPGLRCNEDLGTPGNLKLFSVLQFSGEARLVQIKAAHRCSGERSICRVGCDSRTENSQLPDETPGCSQSQSLGVLCFLLL